MCAMRDSGSGLSLLERLLCDASEQIKKLDMKVENIRKPPMPIEIAPAISSATPPTRDTLQVLLGK